MFKLSEDRVHLGADFREVLPVAETTIDLSNCFRRCAGEFGTQPNQQPQLIQYGVLPGPDLASITQFVFGVIDASDIVRSSIKGTSRQAKFLRHRFNAAELAIGRNLEHHAASVTHIVAFQICIIRQGHQRQVFC